MSLRLVKYPQRSPNFLIRGTVARTSIFESTGTTDRDAALKYLERREAEIYEHRKLAAKPWAEIPHGMEIELRVLAMRARNRSQKRGRIGTNCTFAFLKVLYVQQRGRCAVSGIPFNLTASNPNDPRTRPYAPSVDRVDNNKGYEQGNVRLVCRIANYAMNIWGDKALLELALGITHMWEKKCAPSVPVSSCDGGEIMEQDIDK